MRLGLLVALLLSPSALAQEHSWLATVFPNAEMLGLDYEHLGMFPSLERCQREGQRALNMRGWNQTGTYQCGRNCIHIGGQPPNMLYLCEKTFMRGEKDGAT